MFLYCDYNFYLIALKLVHTKSKVVHANKSDLKVIRVIIFLMVLFLIHWYI